MQCATLGRLRVPPHAHKRPHTQPTIVASARRESPSGTRAERQADVVVLGGGVVGLCCAKSLLEAGLHVVLVERADTAGAGVGGAATGAGQVRERARVNPSYGVGSWVGCFERRALKPLALVLCSPRPLTCGSSFVLVSTPRGLQHTRGGLGRNRAVGSYALIQWALGVVYGCVCG